MDRGADDRSTIEGFQVLLDLTGAPVSLRQSYVEKRLLGDFFIRAGRIHGCGSKRSHKRWCLFKDGRSSRRDLHDVVLRDEFTESAENVAEGLQKATRGRMVLLELMQYFGGTPLRIDPGGYLLELLLVAAEVREPYFEQVLNRRNDHLFVFQFLLVIGGSNPKIALGSRKKILLEEDLI